MSVWITRSAPDNLRTARGLHTLGQKLLMVPVMTTTVNYQPPIEALPDAIVFTSVHALRHFARLKQTLAVPVFVATDLVAAEALAAGYVTVTSTCGSDEALCGLLSHVLQPRMKVLILCGESTSPELAERLRAMSYRVERQIVYRPIPVHGADLSHATANLDRIDAIVVHSRSGADRVVAILRDTQWRGSLWCISAPAAEIVGDLPLVSVKTATYPLEASLLDMVSRLTPRTARRRRSVQHANADLLMSVLQKRSSSARFVPGNNNVDCVSPDNVDPAPGAA